jgi:hypothetical protein
MNQPLLENQDGKATEHVVTRELDVSYTGLKRSSLVLGLIVGLFLQFSTLGANWLVISICGNDVILSASRFQLVTYSLVWSALTSSMSMWILRFLRYVINLVLEVGSRPGFESDSEVQDRRWRIDILILTMESRFVGGALIGVSAAWTATDFLLGLHVQMIYSLVTLFIASLWGCILLRVFAMKDREICGMDPSTPCDVERGHEKTLVPVVLV